MKANPKVYKIVWLHNVSRNTTQSEKCVPFSTLKTTLFFQDAEVENNKAKGVIISGSSLVLQGVTRHMSGTYTCVASNTEGDTASNPVYLQVKCECT